MHGLLNLILAALKLEECDLLAAVINYACLHTFEHNKSHFNKFLNYDMLDGITDVCCITQMINDLNSNETNIIFH